MNVFSIYISHFLFHFTGVLREDEDNRKMCVCDHYDLDYWSVSCDHLVSRCDPNFLCDSCTLCTHNKDYFLLVSGL